MPCNRDEVIAAVNEFYKFLTTHLHFEPSEISTPPPGGWPQINPSRFAFLGKSDAVIDLLKHLPYLPIKGEGSRDIYRETVCANYCDGRADQAVEDADEYEFGPIEEEADGFRWGTWRERPEDVVALGRPGHGRYGNFILLDTVSGEVAAWDVEENGYSSYESAGAFFAAVRQAFKELKFFPLGKHVVFLNRDINEDRDRYQGLKDAIRSFGWPPAKGDESGWRREEGLKEANRLWPEYEYL